MNGKQLLLALWTVCAAWIFALVAAPMTLDPGTVNGLEGHANMIDYAPTWRGLPAFAAAVYTLGDLMCHQMESRSWLVNGNQLPVDSRMMAAFFGAVMLLPFALLVPPLPRARDESVQILPIQFRRRLNTPARRGLFLAFLWAAAVLPAAVDVALQLATGYESTNLRRAWTGFILGGGTAFLTGLVLDSLWCSEGFGSNRSSAKDRDDGQRAEQHA